MRDITITISVDLTTLKLLQDNAFLLSEIASMKDFNRTVDEKRVLQIAIAEHNVKLTREYEDLKRGKINYD